MTGYMFFANEQRANVKAGNPNLSLGKVGLALRQMWQALDMEQREPYLAQARKDEQIYQREKEEFQK